MSAGAAAPDLRDRFRGALVGLAIGDALGAPYEFKVPPFEVADHYRPGVFGTLAGDGTDDSALAGALADSLLEHGEFRPDAYGRRVVAFADSDPPDIGGQTSLAARHLARGERPPESPDAQGNGALMAIAPLALRYAFDTDRLPALAAEFSNVTHPSPTSRACCASFTLALAGLLRGEEPPTQPPESLPAEPAGPKMGWVRLTLAVAHRSAADAHRTSQPALAAYRALVALGGDTDTNATVFGALLGARRGMEALAGPLTDDLLQRDSWVARADALLRLATT